MIDTLVQDSSLFGRTSQGCSTETVEMKKESVLGETLCKEGCLVEKFPYLKTEGGAGDGNPPRSDAEPGRYTQDATLARIRLTPFDSSHPINNKSTLNGAFVIC